MPSPFPGMNPYLEHPDTWEDFHTRFITHAADTLRRTRENNSHAEQVIKGHS